MNSIDAVIASAVEGHGVIRVFLFQVVEYVRSGRLTLLLEDAEPPPVPIHLMTPEGRLSVAKVRAFVDFAVPRLKADFARSSQV